MREPPTFDDAFRVRLHDLFAWRRDVRRFRTDPLPGGCIERLIEVACLSPSVGLSQPWRFVVVNDAARRKDVIADFRSCNAEALQCYAGERATRYAALKLAGLEEAPCHLAVFSDSATGTGHGLGRMTMPEMIDYSVIGAIAMMWLAARAEGIGMGWVSILDPKHIAEILDVPPSWRLMGYFCLGYPLGESSEPELEAAKWEQRLDPMSLIVRR